MLTRLTRSIIQRPRWNRSLFLFGLPAPASDAGRAFEFQGFPRRQYTHICLPITPDYSPFDGRKVLVDLSTEDWLRVRETLDSAVTMTEARGREYVRGRKDLTAPLKEYVLDLLKSGDDDGLGAPVAVSANLFVNAAFDEGPSGRSDGKQRAQSDFLGPSAEQLDREDAAIAARVGTRVGAFRLTREVGRGGMAVVYLGERADGQFHQQVAVKILKRGMDTDDVVSRFARERDILAGLDHPNIARLYDGGLTEDGLPYFTMEYIEGYPITGYSDDKGLSIDGRLRLFLDACDAVHYAHQHLVVHRDLKPANLFVSGEGKVKLLDFGISGLLESDGSDRTVTVTRRLTPAYAAPEQVAGESLTVVTDVYSLGVILYELLTGRLPFTAESGRAVLSQVPEKPSSAVAARTLRSSKEPRAGNSYTRRKLRGDLDTIALTALAPEPVDRYQSADDLRYDVAAFLENRPIKARRPTAAYRVGKYVRRNRTLVIVALLALVLAVAGLTGYMSESNRSERTRASVGLWNPSRTPVIVPDGFTASVFYDDILGPDGIVVLSDDELLVVKEWPSGSAGGVYRARRGTRFQLEDRIPSAPGDNIEEADDLVIAPDGMIYVASGAGRGILRITVDGGPRNLVASAHDVGSDNFNPYGLAIAPNGFDGLNVDPGDLIVADNGYGLTPAVWAINLQTGVSKQVHSGRKPGEQRFGVDGGIRLAFSSDGVLFMGTNCCPSTIHIVSPEGEMTPFIEDLEAIAVLAIHPVTDEIFFTANAGQIHRMPSTGGSPELFADNVDCYHDMEFNEKGTSLFVSAACRMQVMEISASLETWSRSEL